MIPVTKTLHLYKKTMDNGFGFHEGAYMVFANKSLCLTTHPEYDEAVRIAVSQGWVYLRNRYKLTPLGEALMKLMQ